MTARTGGAGVDPSDVPRCAARSKRSGEPCRNFPVHGATVCRIHGGAARQVRRKAAERTVLARAEKAVLALDPDARSGNWIDAMERVLARLEGMEDHLRGELADLEVARVRQFGGEGGEAIHALVQAYTRILDQLGTTAHRMGQLDLDAIRVRIEARQHDAVAAAIGRALEQAGLTAGQQEAVREAIGRELTRMHEEGYTW